MSKQNTGNKKHEPKENSNPTVSSSDEATKKNIQEAKNTYQTRNNTQSQPPIHKRVITLVGDKKNQPLIANIVSFVALLISAILAVFTYYLYHIASGQVDSVVKAGNAAQSSALTAIKTLNETKSYNRTYIKLQKEMFKSDSVSGNKKQKQDSLSFSTQITSLKETQKDFEIENRPFISIVNSNVDTPFVNKPIYVYAQIVNSGKQPAFIIDTYYDIKPSLDSSYKNFEGIDHPKSFINSVITGGGGAIPIHSFTTPITQMQYDHYKEFPLYMYLRAIIIYRSFTGAKKYKTETIYRINTNKEHDTKTMYYKAN
jgi:hypothetical protein